LTDVITGFYFNKSNTGDIDILEMEK